ncbi:hypothetical protein N5P37_011760 [Trichoderma harzianum]|nr:hypothetical protein N5P37_011760 [Trichoderma harzianum]
MDSPTPLCLAPTNSFLSSPPPIETGRGEIHGVYLTPSNASIKGLVTSVGAYLPRHMLQLSSASPSVKWTSSGKYARIRTLRSRTDSPLIPDFPGLPLFDSHARHGIRSVHPLLWMLELFPVRQLARPPAFSEIYKRSMPSRYLITPSASLVTLP